MSEPVNITSRDNPFLKRLRVLAQDNAGYRKFGQVWLEGDHLCRALISRQYRPDIAVFAESVWPSADPALKRVAPKIYLVPDALMSGISGLESPAGMGFVWGLPQDSGILPGVPTVVLDRLQDAGNVGSIVRSAAAMGFAQVLAVKGTAALWAPKVLRAGMGAHFGLRLVEGLSPDDLNALELPVLATSSHEGEWLHEMALPHPCAWVLGHEGQGVGEGVGALTTRSVRIVQPGGEESLNVAAAAAICLHASACAALSRP
jgi:RNA methyltransferase, TrmH family